MCLSAKLFLTAIRARVCGQTGDLQQAAEALDPISNKRIPRLVGAQDWLRTQARLVGIYRKLGRTGDARKIEDE
jgi:hypothetical protein